MGQSGKGIPQLLLLGLNQRSPWLISANVGHIWIGTSLPRPSCFFAQLGPTFKRMDDTLLQMNPHSVQSVNCFVQLIHFLMKVFLVIHIIYYLNDWTMV